MIEIWKPIVGWELFYEVSSFGRIRSLDRISKSGVRKGKVRSLTLTGARRDYLGTLLSAPGRKKVFKKAHVAVLEAFIGPRPGSDYDACHGDGVSTNNRLDNLRWDTKKANNKDKEKHGTHQIGSVNPAAKLDEARVRQIKADLSVGETQSALARRYKVGVTTIWSIKHGFNWAHV